MSKDVELNKRLKENITKLYINNNLDEYYFEKLRKITPNFGDDINLDLVLEYILHAPTLGRYDLPFKYLVQIYADKRYQKIYNELYGDVNFPVKYNNEYQYALIDVINTVMEFDIDEEKLESIVEQFKKEGFKECVRNYNEIATLIYARHDIKSSALKQFKNDIKGYDYEFKALIRNKVQDNSELLLSFYAYIKPDLKLESWRVKYMDENEVKNITIPKPEIDIKTTATRLLNLLNTLENKVSNNYKDRLQFVKSEGTYKSFIEFCFIPPFVGDEIPYEEHIKKVNWFKTLYDELYANYMPVEQIIPNFGYNDIIIEQLTQLTQLNKMDINIKNNYDFVLRNYNRQIDKLPSLTDSLDEAYLKISEDTTITFAQKIEKYEELEIQRRQLQADYEQLLNIIHSELDIKVKQEKIRELYTKNKYVFDPKYAKLFYLDYEKKVKEIFKYDIEDETKDDIEDETKDVIRDDIKDDIKVKNKKRVTFDIEDDIEDDKIIFKDNKKTRISYSLWLFAILSSLLLLVSLAMLVAYLIATPDEFKKKTIIIIFMLSAISLIIAIMITVYYDNIRILLGSMFIFGIVYIAISVTMYVT